MTDIIEVNGYDFGTLGAFKVPLFKRGLVQITGENLDTSAADGNGSGKSTLLRALAWCLYEKTPDGQRADDVVRDGMESCFVETVLRLADKHMVFVRRSRIKGKRKAGVYDVSGKPIVEGAGVDEWIVNALGLDFTAFTSTVLYTPGGRRFGDPEATDAERKTLLHRVLNTGPLEACAAAARKRARQLGEKAAEARAHVEAATKEGERAAKEAVDAEAKNETHAAECEARAVALEKMATQRDAEAAAAEGAARKLEEQLAKLRGAVDAAVNERASAVDARIAAQADYDASKEVCNDFERKAAAVEVERKRAQDEADKYATGKCPMCDAPVDPSDRSAAAKRLTKEAKAARAAWDRAAKDGELVTSRLREAKDAERAAEEVLRTAQKNERDGINKSTTAKAAAMTAENMRADAVSLRERATEARAAPSPWLELARAARARQESAKAKVGRASTLATAADAEVGVAEFWAKGFGQEGLPALMLENAVPELEELANGYLRALADGDIVLRMTASSETKAGDAREKIGVTWEIEGVVGRPPSTGQRKKLEIATGLALMDLACARSGARPDLLLMDEALDGLDATGRGRVISLLRSLRLRRGSILVVTHEPMAEAFDHELRVTKRDGVAAVEER